jgi:hypothetical protein
LPPHFPLLEAVAIAFDIRDAAELKVYSPIGAQPRRRFSTPRGQAVRWRRNRLLGCSSALGVVLHAGEVEDDTRLVADHFAVVTGWDCDHVSRTELELGAVIHDDLLMPRKDIA